MSEEAHFTIHGVRMTLRSDRRESLEPSDAIYQRYKSPPTGSPELLVNIVRAERFWGVDSNAADSHELEESMEQLGRRIFVRGATVYVSRFVRYAGLSVLRRTNASTTVFDMIYDQSFLDGEIGRDPWQNGHQLFGIWPLATCLAQRRNMFFLHGGAVTFEGRNIVFCGLQGVGKSTLILLMLKDPQERFLSDNVYFHDAERVYACPETIRLDEKSIQLACPPADLLLNVGHHSDLGRTMYVANPRRTTETFRPDFFLIPRFHPDKSAILPARADAKDLFMAFSELAMEVNAYSQWAAPFLLQDGAFSTKRLCTLDVLLKDRPVYHLHIRKGDDPERLLDLIRKV